MLMYWEHPLHAGKYFSFISDAIVIEKIWNLMNTYIRVHIGTYWVCFKFLFIFTYYGLKFYEKPTRTPTTKKE